jgi:CRISPR-associated endonuclease/helicase Cas3
VADRLEHPALVIVEAPMGEGKTEAALYVADRGNAALGMRGHYVALPTQATSNQMFGRVCDFLQTRYPDEVVNAQLLHGHASLVSDFAALTTTETSFLGALDIPRGPESRVRWHAARGRRGVVVHGAQARPAGPVRRRHRRSGAAGRAPDEALLCAIARFGRQDCHFR